MKGIDQDDRNWPVVTHTTNSVERSMNPAQLRTVSGDEARNLLEEQISKHNGGLLSTLAVYDASETVRVWHDTIRAMEEFINVPFYGLDDEALIAWLMAVPLDERFFRNPASVKNVAAASPRWRYGRALLPVDAPNRRHRERLPAERTV
jgi:hypothetical protein